jgi:hypothetical protein
MNERIRQLAEQALFESEFDDEQNIKITMDIFAELIVRDCIERITNYDLVPGHSAKWEDIYDIHSRLLQDLSEDLKEYFGVEE